MDFRHAIAGFFALPLAISCSSNSSPTGPDNEDASVGTGGTGGSGGASATCQDTGEQIDIDGLFALSVRLSFTFSSQPGGAVTVCPVDQTNEGTFLGFAKVEHLPGQTTATVAAVACWLDLPVVSAIVGVCNPDASNVVQAGLRFPEALLDAAPTVDTAESTLFFGSPTAGSSISADGLRFSLGTHEPMATAPVWLLDKPICNDNAAGRSPACEETCVNDCSKSVDHDNDGFPGVTVHVCGYTDEDKKNKIPCNAETPNEAGATIQGRAFMNLQVEPLTLSGQILSSCEIAGNIDASFAYNVVGADLYLSNTQISVSSAIKSLPQYQVNSSESRFRVVRIDGKHGSANWGASWSSLLKSCRQIIANQHDLR